MEAQVTAIVPCYNEEGRVGKILDALLTCPLIDKVIVVDDASTDGTHSILESYKKIKLITNIKNLGKGGSIREGLKNVATPITFMCDADVLGINNKELEKIILPVKDENYDACLGIVFTGGKLIQLFRHHVMVLTGERAIKTSILRDVVKSPYINRWGLESYMNFYFRHHNTKIKKVDIFVKNIWQMKKVGLLKRLYTRVYTLTVIYLKILFLELGELIN